jgi:hypothetical protein
MKNIARNTSLFLLLAFSLVLMGGCSKDSSSNPAGPSDSQNATNPTVSANWRGSATRADGSVFAITASITQNGDKLAETCFWSSGGTVKAITTYNGTVTTKRQIALQGVRFFNNPVKEEWDVDNHTATLSSAGDTISGTYAGQTNQNMRGTFVLLKQSSSETYPAVAPNWSGNFSQGSESYRDTAYFVQALNLIGGYMLVSSGPGWITTEYFNGTITASRDITLAATSKASSIVGWEKYWPTNSYKGRMCASGDTLYLPFTAPDLGGWSGNLVLVKR